MDGAGQGSWGRLLKSFTAHESSRLTLVDTDQLNCYENRRQTHTVIPAKAGIHRDEGARHFHLSYVA